MHASSQGMEALQQSLSRRFCQIHSRLLVLGMYSWLYGTHGDCDEQTCYTRKFPLSGGVELYISTCEPDYFSDSKLYVSCIRRIFWGNNFAIVAYNLTTCQTARAFHVQRNKLSISRGDSRPTLKHNTEIVPGLCIFRVFPYSWSMIKSCSCILSKIQWYLFFLMNSRTCCIIDSYLNTLRFY